VNRATQYRLRPSKVPYKRFFYQKSFCYDFDKFLPVSRVTLINLDPFKNDSPIHSGKYDDDNATCKCNFSYKNLVRHFQRKYDSYAG